jgi:soluble lytic murein transglycosylase
MMFRIMTFAVAAATVLAAPPIHAQARLTADQHYLAAREANAKNNAAALAPHARALKGTILEPYADFWTLRLRLEQAAPGEVSDFLGRYTGAYVAELLRREWLVVLGKRQQWEIFDAAFPNLVIEDPDTTCYALQSRWRRGDGSAAEEFRRVWASPRELPDGCVAIAESEIAAGKLTVRHVWERARLLLQSGQAGPAKRALDYLPANEQPDDRTLDAIRAQPAKFIERAEKLDFKRRANRELLLYAFARQARLEVSLAASLWTKKLQGLLPPEDQAWVWGQLATQAARNHDPRAVEWFGNANGVALLDEQLEWRVRAALRAGDWPDVRTAIEKMTPIARADPAWTYWTGRSLRAAGAREEADQFFAVIAADPSFYGKLALEELGRPLAVPPRGYEPSAEEVREAAANPGLQRAVALFRIDTSALPANAARDARFDAVREWNWSLRGMDDRQLLAAAEFARRNELWDRAINSADRTVGMHDFQLRFLAPYRDAFGQHSRAQGLEEAWVLGLVRQESRFIVNARSSAGASGLMQLMPATARWVAKRNGMRDFAPAQVNDVEVNIALGTSYLRYVLDELEGSPVLAAAAYNAGPGRARKWKAERSLEGAIYAESIPFNETRDYVKRVLSNTMYYAALYGGEGRSLKSRLGTIPGRHAGEGYAPTITGQATVQ